MKEPHIIYQDNDLIVINKPAGMPVHEAKHSDDYSLCDWLLRRFPEIKDVGDKRPENMPPVASGVEPYRPGIVHRLDKQTSGVMVIARNQASFLKLKELFKSRRVEKTYTALVCGRLKKSRGEIKTAIGRLIKTPMKMAVQRDEPRLGKAGRGMKKKKIRLVKEASTEYKVLKEFAKTSLLEVHPRTGRMHQIRLHLASIGHPVAGDTVYGGKKVCHHDLGRQFLHASMISFTLHDGERLMFEADLPQKLQTVLRHEAVVKTD
ncbi:MAG: RluA family pseudouridine synthase [Candidatus Sungbacteria bacterium]|uniref:Pseudouridine synthase n=1 Tax=Candidatus Sungiibacteriota bacterium TaxID=2750080 RepID=A0A9D6LSZ2_9BACT|nr:RluA family pseudouridine synthase [Candidatus Sungbacteria bacterium]